MKYHYQYHGEASFEVNHAEHTEVDRLDVVNGFSEENNAENDQPRDNGTGLFVSDNVVNISSRILTQAEVSLLSKGLKFCPTPKELDWSVIKRDVKEFGRKIRCKEYFLSRAEESSQNFRQFKEKSSWVPSEVDPAIEVYCSKLEEKVSAITTGGGGETTVIFLLRK